MYEKNIYGSSTLLYKYEKNTLSVTSGRYILSLKFLPTKTKTSEYKYFKNFNKNFKFSADSVARQKKTGPRASLTLFLLYEVSYELSGHLTGKRPSNTQNMRRASLQCEHSCASSD
jgi:hypothetical protein